MPGGGLRRPPIGGSGSSHRATRILVNDNRAMAIDPRRSYRDPARELSVIGTPDVLVVGAGSAGVAAAVAAARRGADTMLIEASGHLGGLATVGLINLLLTLDDGVGTQVVAGLCQEVVNRLEASGSARYPRKETWASEAPELVASWRDWGLIWGSPEAVRYSVAFDPEAFVDICYDLLEEAGAQLRLHTWFAAAPVSGSSIDAVIVESKRGREAICPRVVIDATGDGDVLVSAGGDSNRSQFRHTCGFGSGECRTLPLRSTAAWVSSGFAPTPRVVSWCRSLPTLNG